MLACDSTLLLQDLTVIQPDVVMRATQKSHSNEENSRTICVAIFVAWEGIIRSIWLV